ncbi:Uncharacterised protein [Mycobacteroides abscessus subsp. abscessus]|nr:Uncharacterised protein [Mycobacteroides abscessus subsp. abscessus]
MHRDGGAAKPATFNLSAGLDHRIQADAIASRVSRKMEFGSSTGDVEAPHRAALRLPPRRGILRV